MFVLKGSKTTLSAFLNQQTLYQAISLVNIVSQPFLAETERYAVSPQTHSCPCRDRPVTCA